IGTNTYSLTRRGRQHARTPQRRQIGGSWQNTQPERNRNNSKSKSLHAGSITKKPRDTRAASGSHEAGVTVSGEPLELFGVVEDGLFAGLQVVRQRADGRKPHHRGKLFVAERALLHFVADDLAHAFLRKHGERDRRRQPFV